MSTASVILFHGDPDRITDERWFARQRAYLDPFDVERLAWVSDPVLANRFVFTRALERAALSHCSGVPQAAWMFERSTGAKPRARRPLANWRFSTSSTATCVACAVSWEREVGVDVEHTAGGIDVAAMVERHFSPGERRRWSALGTEAQRTQFFQLWTLKEAYAKARGLGLALALDATEFSIVAGSVTERLGASDFAFRVHARHSIVMAIAVEASTSVRVKFIPYQPRSRVKRPRSRLLFREGPRHISVGDGCHE